MQNFQGMPTRDLIGLHLGNYRIERLLGQGGFADVYLGRHIYLHNDAAIKVLHHQRDGIELSMNAFLAEARIASQFIHPHIVRVLEFGVEAGERQALPYLVMDYALNGTLRQKYPQGSQLAPGIILQHLQAIAEAVDYIHGKGYIHRDLKPENMLLGSKNELWLSDFGITIAAQSITGKRVPIGTAAYMAPEQIAGHPCKQSDIYALGVIVYEWFSGYPPFSGNSVDEILFQHLYIPVPSLRQQVPHVMPIVEQAVFQALEKTPEKRFQTAGEFVDALRNALEPRPIILRGNSMNGSNSASFPRQQSLRQPLQQLQRQPSQCISHDRQRRRAREMRRTWREIAFTYGLNVLIGGCVGSIMALFSTTPLLAATLLMLSMTLFPLIIAFIRENMTLFSLTMSFIVTAAIFGLAASNLVVFDVIYSFLLLLSLLTAFVVNINRK